MEKNQALLPFNHASNKKTRQLASSITGWFSSEPDWIRTKVQQCTLMNRYRLNDSILVLL
jgi:hypothetical protein